MRACLKNTQHKKELLEQFKWWSTCLASMRLYVQAPVLQKQQQQKV
jgi:hypothetical protein